MGSRYYKHVDPVTGAVSYGDRTTTTPADAALFDATPKPGNALAEIVWQSDVDAAAAAEDAKEEEFQQAFEDAKTEAEADCAALDEAAKNRIQQLEEDVRASAERLADATKAADQALGELNGSILRANGGLIQLDMVQDIGGVGVAVVGLAGTILTGGLLGAGIGLVSTGAGALNDLARPGEMSLSSAVQAGGNASIGTLSSLAAGAVRAPVAVAGGATSLLSAIVSGLESAQTLPFVGSPLEAAVLSRALDIYEPSAVQRAALDAAGVDLEDVQKKADAAVEAFEAEQSAHEEHEAAKKRLAEEGRALSEQVTQCVTSGRQARRAAVLDAYGKGEP